MSLKILIIEDEPLAAHRLERILIKIDPSIKIAAKLESVRESVDYFTSNQAKETDLILADIHLCDGNSFSIFEQVEVKTPIVFITAYDQYAVKAFKLNSIDYLLKPVNKDELKKALDKFKESRGRGPAPDLRELISALNLKSEKTDYLKRFVLTVGDKIKPIKIEDVNYFYGQDKYVYLVNSEGQRFLIDFTLSKLDNLLDPEKFFRINRQYIVSYDSIKNLYAYSRSRVKVELEPAVEESVIVSSDKSRAFKDWLNG